MICLDIDIDGSDSEKFSRVLRRVKIRKPKQGQFHLREDGKVRRSSTRGGESRLLARMSKKRVRGKFLGVDGIYEKGINTSFVVDDAEHERLRQSPSFKIRETFDVGKYRRK